jgi:hypothetical protein
MKMDSGTVFEHFKKNKGRKSLYDEERHCKLLIDLMLNPDKGTMTSFCVAAMITEATFWTWVREHELFGDLYSFGKLLSRENWEADGRKIRDMQLPIGTVSYEFEYWKLIGWSRFGVSKNARIKLNLNPNDTPDKHYSQLLKQASEGDFTAAEIKQLMEAVNVGLNTHQVFELQKQIDGLKSDLETMQTNTDGHNSGTVKGLAKAD